mmetsp:Transcript_20060/g.40837  ORF Transcript_20060/g.40837 Transcript_20060/m.40837 type:complete len:212 (-) Transcript_20060:791-1426(-)
MCAATLPITLATGPVYVAHYIYSSSRRLLVWRTSWTVSRPLSLVHGPSLGCDGQVAAALPDLVAFLAVPSPPQHILAGRQIGRHVDHVDNLERGLGAASSVLHARTHACVHAKGRARRREANACLPHVIARDRVLGPHAASWSGAARRVCAIKCDLEAAMRPAPSPAQPLLTDKGERDPSKRLLVQGAVCRRETIRVASAVVRLNRPAHLV